jgi:hypothetical protein
VFPPAHPGLEERPTKDRILAGARFYDGFDPVLREQPEEKVHETITRRSTDRAKVVADAPVQALLREGAAANGASSLSNAFAFAARYLSCWLRQRCRADLPQRPPMHPIGFLATTTLSI